MSASLAAMEVTQEKGGKKPEEIVAVFMCLRRRGVSAPPLGGSSSLYISLGNGIRKKREAARDKLLLAILSAVYFSTKVLIFKFENMDKLNSIVSLSIEGAGDTQTERKKLREGRVIGGSNA